MSIFERHQRDLELRRFRGARALAWFALVLVPFVVPLAEGQTSAPRKAAAPPAKKPVARAGASKAPAPSASKAAKPAAARPSAASTKPVAGAKPTAGAVRSTSAVVSKSSARPQQARPAAVAAAARPTGESGGNGWTRAVVAATRTVRAADSLSSPGLSESPALAIDSQFLAMPWEFVSKSWIARPGSRFFVENQEAHLIDIDVASNLALFKTDQMLMPSLSRASFRLDVPSAEEPFAVMLGRDWFRSGARMLRVKSEGSTQIYQMALGNGDATGSRFVFDKAGRLVAIAPGGETGEKAWAGSSRALYEMLRRQDGPKPASVPGATMRRNQLYGWQDRWTQAVSPQSGAWSLQSLDCQSHMVSVSDKNLASSIRNTRAVNCTNRFPLSLGAGYSTGIELVAGEVQLSSRDGEAGSKVAQALGSELFNDLHKSASFVNLMTVADCQTSQVTNKQGHPVQVHFCTSALKTEPGLNDTAIAVSSLDAGAKAYVAVARFKGFAQPNTRRLIEGLIENLRSFR